MRDLASSQHVFDCIILSIGDERRSPFFRHGTFAKHVVNTLGIVTSQFVRSQTVIMFYYVVSDILLI